MYATNGMVDILGVPADELTGKSFYFCIQENCLREAVRCLESAKANDSIAYLRFWFRDPRQDDSFNHDESMSDAHSSGDEDESGGVHLSELLDRDGTENAIASESSNSMRSSLERDHNYLQNDHLDPNSRSSSGNSTDNGRTNGDLIFDQPAGRPSRTSSVSTPEDSQVSGGPWFHGCSQIEVEAVVSCTSDGLVVILRRAKPFIPQVSHPASIETTHPYANGVFASPWASDPILPRMNDHQQPYLMPHLRQPGGPVHPTATQANSAANNGPATEQFMNSIREVAVFAWSLTGINGSLEQYARGTPTGESQPPGGLPIWDPNSNAGPEVPRFNLNGYVQNGQYNGHQNIHSSRHQTNGNSNDTYKHSSLQNRGDLVQNSSFNKAKQGNPRQINGYTNQAKSNTSWLNGSERGRLWDSTHLPNQISNVAGNNYDNR